MYTFSIEKENVPIIKVTINSNIVEKDVYLKDLIEKCFQRIFLMVREEKKDYSTSEEADIEDDD